MTMTSLIPARGKSLLALLRNNSGAAIVEFGLLAPVFLTMMFGMLQVGVYLQNYNAVQSVASDGARYVMVEYQKDNELSDEQISSVMLGVATNAPYILDTDRIVVNIDRTGESRVDGATEIDISIEYTLNDFVPGVELPLTVVRYSRSVWVVT
jgi:Flp pilus assembly protein TadG